MALNPIFKIPVDDSAFKQFQAAFQKYSDTLNKQPSQWANVGKETSTFTSRFKKSIEEVSVPMAGLVKSTSQIASNISRATISLLKFAGISTAITGLLGLGGILGIDRLGYIASAQRRSALGLGVSTGEQNAFRINYGRFVQPDNLLSNIANTKNDLANRWAFSAMGVSNVDQKNPAELAAEMTVKAKSIFERYGQSQQAAEAHGLLQFFTMEDLRRLHNTSNQELGAAAQGYGRDKNALGLNDNDLRMWQDFTTQLSRASATIESTFIRGLTPLTGPLMRLSQAFSHLIDIFLKSDIVKHWIDVVAGGLERLGKWISSPDFEKDVEGFIDDIRKMSQAIGKAVEWIAGFFINKDDKTGGTGIDPQTGAYDPTKDKKSPQYRSFVDRWLGNTPGVNAPPTPGANGAQGDPTRGRGPWDGMTPYYPSNDTAPAAGDAAKAIQARLVGYGWSKEQIAGIVSNVQFESSFNPKETGDGGQAYGLGQWHPDRQALFKNWKGFDIRQASFNDQVDFINHELNNSESIAGNALRNAKKAAEAGEIVSRMYERPGVTQSAKNWEATRRAQLAERTLPTLNDNASPIDAQFRTQMNLPAPTGNFGAGDPTFDYLMRPIKTEQPPPAQPARIQVNVNNATGGSAAVTVNQLVPH